MNTAERKARKRQRSAQASSRIVVRFWSLILIAISVAMVASTVFSGRPMDEMRAGPKGEMAPMNGWGYLLFAVVLAATGAYGLYLTNKKNA